MIKIRCHRLNIYYWHRIGQRIEKNGLCLDSVRTNPTDAPVYCLHTAIVLELRYPFVHTITAIFLILLRGRRPAVGH